MQQKERTKGSQQASSQRERRLFFLFLRAKSYGFLPSFPFLFFSFFKLFAVVVLFTRKKLIVLAGLPGQERAHAPGV